MEEKKKSNKGLIVVIIILALLLVGSVGYICYDKILVSDVTTNEKSNVKNDKNATSDKEELDINSRLVQNLYGKVSTGEMSKEEASCNFNYMYGYDDKDFYVNKADKETKMSIIGRLLTDEYKRIYVGDKSLIPDRIPGVQGYASVFAMNKVYNRSDSEYYYSKDYVERIFKEVYGKNVVLDTSVSIETAAIAVELYHYVSAVDKYILYMIEGGGTCGPEGAYGTITKAIKNGNELKIYEKVTKIALETASVTDENGNEVSYQENQILGEENYVYTFELEDDGMYKYISRVKES